MTAPITDHVWRPDIWQPAHRRTDTCAYAWCDQPRGRHQRAVSPHRRRAALLAERFPTPPAVVKRRSTLNRGMR